MTSSAVVYPPAPPRLQALGFTYDPFAYLEAEKVPVGGDFLEKTFVSFPGEAQVSDFARSTILLAQPGGGKTRVRLRLESKLSNHLYDFMQGLPVEAFPKAPLVVRYLNFERLVSRLPNLTLTDHRDPLLEAMASAAWQFIERYPERFSQAAPELRAWWWRFLHQYIEDDRIERKANGVLRVEWEQYADYPPVLGTQATLTTILMEILPEQIKGLGFDSLFILMDGVDGWMETQSPELQGALVNPFINSHHLLSSPGLVWKFFMPKNVLKQMTQSAGVKTDRLSVVHLEWAQTDLEDILNNRLYWASKGEIEDFKQLFIDFSFGTQEAIEQLADMALRHRSSGPPRAILNLGSRLFATEFYKKDLRVNKYEWRSFVKDVRPSLRLLTVSDSKKREIGATAGNITTGSTSKQKVKVFISYAHEDQKIALDLYMRINLKKHDFEAFMDKDIRGGEEIPNEIAEKLSDSDCQLVIWSRPAKASKWVASEINLGLMFLNDKKTRLQKTIFLMTDKTKLPKVSQSKKGLPFDEHDPKNKAYQENMKRIFSTLMALKQFLSSVKKE